MSEGYRSVRFEIADGIARFTMNRPEILNPLTEDLRADFKRMLDEVEGNEAVRVLVLAGEGRAFSAGGDVKGMYERAKTGVDTAGVRRSLLQAHDWLERLRNLEVPVVAAVDGLAFGGGFSFALVSDFVFASSRARFCCVFGRIGLVPDLAVMYTLPRVVGMQRAKELMYTARSFGPEEAQAMGIVHSVHEPDALAAAVDAFAGRLARGSREALAQMKRTVNASFESGYGDMARAEADSQALMFTTGFNHEAVRRFVEKEDPLYDWDRLQRAADGDD